METVVVMRTSRVFLHDALLKLATKVKRMVLTDLRHIMIAYGWRT